MPIDLHIHNLISYDRKIQKINLNSECLDVPQADNDDYRSQIQMLAKQAGFLVIPEYDFDHVIYQMAEKTLT